MTHDELLEMVKFEVDVAQERYLEQGFPFAKALFATVELHKPVLHSEHEYICEGCNLVYPCDTIEAIEKELQ